MIFKWNDMEYDTLNNLVRILNQIRIQQAQMEDLESFIEANREELSNPLYLQVYMEVVMLDQDFFNDFPFICNFVFGIMEANSDWTDVPFDTFRGVKAVAFKNRYQAFLETSK